MTNPAAHPSPADTEAGATPPAIHPARQARVGQALKRFRVAAITTGVFLLILVAKMIYAYGVVGKGNEPQWFDYIGIAHGLVYMVYIATSLDLGTKARWVPAKWITTMLAGVVPFLSFYIEHKRRLEVEAAFHLTPGKY